MAPDQKNTKPEAENSAESAEQKLGPEAVPPPAEQPREDDRLARLMADFDNFRKRTAKDMAIERQRGRRDAVGRVIPVLDSVDMALLALAPDSPYRAGIEGVRTQLLSAFDSLGLKKVETIGKQFDPQVHEAIAHMPSADHAQGIIIQESRAGFADEAGLYRAAQVVVSAGS